eukprot:613854-Pleurochrysis_carterae.AAC.2
MGRHTGASLRARTCELTHTLLNFVTSARRHARVRARARLHEQTRTRTNAQSHAHARTHERTQKQGLRKPHRRTRAATPINARARIRFRKRMRHAPAHAHAPSPTRPSKGGAICARVRALRECVRPPEELRAERLGECGRERRTEPALELRMHVAHRRVQRTANLRTMTRDHPLIMNDA